MKILGKVRRDLRRAARADKARVLARFFKTGPGEYGEGDRFIGVAVPDIRRVVKRYAESVALVEILKLLRSAIHEDRLCALLMLVRKYDEGDDMTRGRIYRAYIKNTRCVNNWDLVDLTAPNIVGAWLWGRPKRVLTKLARSRSVWERRIAMLATFYDIRHRQPAEAIRIAKMLLSDEHDLIHKAVGWMLREVGKRCSVVVLEKFLQKHGRRMPRTALRYAIERFSETKRKAYLRA